jgi:adenine-specific DNA-methyltransferase
LANTWLDNIASNQEATREIKEIFGELLFDAPKPTGLLKFCLNLASDKDSIILDFFAGSCTTAHAVMQLNAEDRGSRKFIMVQLPEAVDEKSEAYKMGYKNICEIGKERIRRAGEKINEEIVNKNNQLKLGEEAKSLVDVGFRVLKVDSTK